MHYLGKYKEVIMKLKKKVMAAVLASAVSMSLIVPSFAIDLPMTYEVRF